MGQNMADWRSPVSLGWEWDDDRGGFKPKGDSGWSLDPSIGLVKVDPQPEQGFGSSEGGSGGGGSSDYSSSSVAPSAPTSAVKTATPDILVDSGTIPVELMQDLLFEDIGGQELLMVSRHDTIIGQPVAYQPIKNLNEISLQYNSDNIIFMPESIKNYFKNFNISLQNNVPVVEEDGEEIDLSPNTYASNNGSLVLEFKNLGQNQQVEIQILDKSALFDDTIYVGTGI
jgi:hypothetical protein